jgi:hypothetical protein
MPPKSPLPGREAAEALALQAVAMIAADEDLLPRFLALTGCGLDELRARLAESEFLGAVLDFVLENDETAEKLAELAGILPEILLLARSKLPGGAVEW